MNACFVILCVISPFHRYKIRIKHEEFIVLSSTLEMEMGMGREIYKFYKTYHTFNIHVM